MKLQDIEHVKAASSQDTELVLRGAVQRLNIAGRRVLNISPAGKDGYFILHEDASPPLPPSQSAPPAIRATPDVLTLTPGESRQLLVLFDNMPPAPLSYRVLTPGGGSVDSIGLYTAPQENGVYELQIACKENPDVETRVFVAVNPVKRATDVKKEG